MGLDLPMMTQFKEDLKLREAVSCIMPELILIFACTAGAICALVIAHDLFEDID